MAPLPTLHWLCPVSRVAVVTKGHDAVPTLGGPLLQHCRHRGRVTVALPWHRCYGVAVALTNNNVAVASPSHCCRAAVVLMQRRLMLGAGARHRCSRPSRRTRCPCSRSRRSRRRRAVVEPLLRPLPPPWSPRCVAVTPSRSRRLRRRFAHAVAQLSLRHCRRRGHMTLSPLHIAMVP